MPRPSGASPSSRPPLCSSTTGRITSPPPARAAGGASCTAATTARSPPCATSRSRAEGRSCDPGHLRDPAAHGFERLHDVRLVRAPEESRRTALVPGGAGELGHRLFRVSAAGAGQPYRLHAPVAAAAEDHAGSDHTLRVRAVRRAVHGQAAEARLPMGGRLHPWCGIFRVPFAGRIMKNEAIAEPPTPIHAQVIAAREGRDPRVIARLFSGWAVFGERQFVRGYAVLLPDPVVPNLNALGARERIAFLSDMSRLGDALLKVTGATRINYAIFGNQEPALHAHVIPRYVDEPEALRGAQPWAYNWSAAPAFERASCQELAENLLRELTRLGVTKPMRFNPGANADG